MKKTIGIIITILVSLIFMTMLFFVWNKPKNHITRLFYFDTYIEIKYETKKNEKKIDANIEEILKHYHKLANRYEPFDKNIYYLIHNKEEEKEIEVKEELYELLKYSLSWKEKSNGKVEIEMGCILDIWNEHREKKEGIPTQEELRSCKKTPLILLEGNKVLNNHANIDLGSIAKGYASEKVKEYLEKEGIINYIINAGGNVIVGKKGKTEHYKIGIQDPNKNGIFTYLNINNKAIVTSGGYERYYEYEKIRYHHLIDPETNFPGNYTKSVTVIASSSALADALSTTLFLMTPEEGMEFLKEFQGVDAIWYTLDNQVIKTEGCKNYE